MDRLLDEEVELRTTTSTEKYQGILYAYDAHIEGSSLTTIILLDRNDDSALILPNCKIRTLKKLKRSSDDPKCDDKTLTETKITHKNFKLIRTNDGQDEQREGIDPIYWTKRFFLFSRFNHGIQMDEESWYSVTPEPIAIHIAERVRCSLVVDACAGAGGNSIQFAFTCEHVIAVDIDPAKVQLAKNNASVYCVDDRIDFVLQSIIDFLSELKPGSVDVVFLSPPWGGPGYKETNEFSLLRDVLLTDKNGRNSFNGVDLFRLARSAAKMGVAYFLPRNCDLSTITDELGEIPNEFEHHTIYKGTKDHTICAYFGQFLK